MKNQALCRECFFGWKDSVTPNDKIFCEYYLVTGKNRTNTDQTCDSYLKGRTKGMTTDEKQKVYRRMVVRGKI